MSARVFQVYTLCILVRRRPSRLGRMKPCRCGRGHSRPRLGLISSPEAAWKRPGGLLSGKRRSESVQEVAPTAVLPPFICAACAIFPSHSRCQRHHSESFVLPAPSFRVFRSARSCPAFIQLTRAAPAFSIGPTARLSHYPLSLHPRRPRR